jgi:hypothetical protein
MLMAKLALRPPLACGCHAALAGPAGRPGIAGARGNRGATGPRGFKGARGLPGRDGANGRNGQPGAPGGQGNRGAVGPRGLPGLPGAGGGGGFDASKLQEFYGKVQGVVRRASDASFVAGATVRLMADKNVSARVGDVDVPLTVCKVLRTVKSNSNGRFSINAPGGRYVLSISGIPSMSGVDFTEPVEVLNNRVTRFLSLPKPTFGSFFTRRTGAPTPWPPP